MLRGYLIPYLVFILAADPLFCCCTSKRLLNQFSTPSSSYESNAQHPCCGHLLQTCPTQNADEDPFDNSTTRPAGGCPAKSNSPCRDCTNCLKVCSSATQEVGIAQPDAPSQEVAGTPCPVPSVADFHRNFERFGIASVRPFLSPHDLLYAHHLLRC